ncbi:MAG TPA: SCO family protein, partial [Polyangiaceae bacterium]|nr:SCO family protein [Polyangiaceae bacterium]
RRLPLATRFTTSDGKSVALGDVLGRGQSALLSLSYSHCALMCSTVLRGAADVARELGGAGDRFALVNVSIDPRESPGEAARVQAPLLERAGLAGRPEHWPFLVGTQASIDAVASAVGFRYAWDARTRQYAHPAALFVIDRDGVIRRYFYGIRFDRDATRRALFGADPGQAPAAAPLTCFRFDTLERRFGARLTWFFRAGAAAILALGAAGLIALRRAERRRTS